MNDLVYKKVEVRVKSRYEHTFKVYFGQVVICTKNISKRHTDTAAERQMRIR